MYLVYLILQIVSAAFRCWILEQNETREANSNTFLKWRFFDAWTTKCTICAVPLCYTGYNTKFYLLLSPKSLLIAPYNSHRRCEGECRGWRAGSFVALGLSEAVWVFDIYQTVEMYGVRRGVCISSSPSLCGQGLGDIGLAHLQKLHPLWCHS